ncbi:MAG TPA: phospholipase C, phosphocholine-specific [Verrucomicrobiae bacterium]|nr:phospholipase C, phosphocholine-specific [Verrucomicrobiae bacterium]
MNSKLNPKGAAWLVGIFLLAGVPCGHAVSGTNRISAANINVVQNDTNNNATSVTLSTPVSINDFRVINGTLSSQADYFVQIGASATDDVTNGILISSIDQNGRDNGESGAYYGVNFGTSAIDSGATASPGSSGQWWIPVFQAPENGEYNFNVAAAYFPYTEGWLGGWLNNATGVNGGANNHFIGNTNLHLGTQVVDNSGGLTKVDLRAFGLDGRTNAVLLAVGGKNEANFATGGTNTDGTWTVRCRDDNGGAEQDYIAFVCVPLTNHTVISGKFRGDTGIVLQSEPFIVTSIGVGTYHLSIPGVNPANGVLIISPEGDGLNNVDNIVSYQLNGDGWDIQSRDITKGFPPQLQQLPDSDNVASFVFIPKPPPGSLTWVGSPQNSWGLTGGNVWRNTGDGTSASYADGCNVSFDDSASNFTVSVTGTVSPAGIALTDSAHDYVLSGSGKISGATGLLKQGSGALTLGTTNNYTGNTAISQGTLALGASGAIPGGNGFGDTSLGGTLNLAGFNATLNNLSGGGTLQNIGGAATLTVYVTTNATFSGTLGNGGPLTLVVTGGGLLNLSGWDYFTGGTTVTNATLAINNVLTTSNVVVQSGGTLAGTGVINSVVTCAAGSSLLLTPKAPLTVGALTLNGAVNVAITGNISLTNRGAYVLLQHGAETGGGSFTLSQPPGLQCYGFKAMLVDTATQLKLVVTNTPLNGTISDIRHVVLLMNENRSYDHYFGTLHGGRGFDDRNVMTLTNGLNAFHQPTGSGSAYELPFHSSETCLTDLNHTWPVTHSTFNDGRSDQWVPNKTSETMVYYNRADLLYYYELADAYTICDEYHAGAISCTYPNRIMFMTGTLDPHSTGGGPELDNTQPLNGFTWKTYPEMLQAAGVSWNIYQVNDDDSDNVMKQFAAYKQAKPGDPLYDHAMVIGNNIAAMIDLFQNDVASNTLPSVSWIIGPSEYTEHPPNSPANGQMLTKAILDAIASNPDVYNSTVFIVNYDENDGFFDHAMPILPPFGTPDEFVGNLPIGLGVRVPLLIASPWTRGGHVCSQVFDHTSTLRFLEDWTGVVNPNISAWRRQVCGDLTSAFDFAHPDFNYPASSFTDVTGVTCPDGTTVIPPNTQTMPTQEAGTLTPRPLPYQPNAFCTLNSTANTLGITMTNSGAASFHFAVYPNAFRADAPQPYDVLDGASAGTAYDLSATTGKYDFSCYGPDGFQRRFAGTLASDYQKIEAISILSPTNGGIAIALENLSTSAVTFGLTNGYTLKASSFAAPAHSTNVVSIGSETNGGLYDVTVTAAGVDSTFARRFLGRVEITLIVAPSVYFSATPVNGNFKFNFGGPVGQSYKVLVTTNLAASSGWQIISAGIFGNTDTNFTETNSITSQPWRFYRVVSP